MVASGTGFAIKSILEDAFRRGVDREMVLYWGARKAKDLYLADLPPQVGGGPARFPLRAGAVRAPEATGTGRTGFVHKAVMEDFPSLAGREV
jgi:CDP-4-dehydro-6-deoxyglucose reductase